MDVNLIEQLVEERLSQREIADRLGCSQTKVSRWMRDNKISTVARRGPKATYSDALVEELTPQATSWEDLRRSVFERTGTKPGRESIESAVERLGVDISHFTVGHPSHPPLLPVAPATVPELGAVSSSKACEYYAATWYSLAGATVSFTSEARYDLVADFGGDLVRVQVKGTNLRRRGGWEAQLTSLGYSAEAEVTAAGKRAIRPYTEDEIDEFFIVCGDGSCYRIPRGAVDGWKSAVFPGRLGGFEVERPWG